MSLTHINSNLTKILTFQLHITFPLKKRENVFVHTYYVNLTIAGNTLDKCGFLVNFRDLKKLVHEQFDHYLLNDLPAFKDKSPSTEIVAQTIYHIIQKELNQRENQPKCVQVYLRETPSSYVVYRPKEDQV